METVQDETMSFGEALGEGGLAQEEPVTEGQESVQREGQEVSEEGQTTEETPEAAAKAETEEPQEGQEPQAQDIPEPSFEEPQTAEREQTQVPPQPPLQQPFDPSSLLTQEEINYFRKREEDLLTEALREAQAEYRTRYGEDFDPSFASLEQQVKFNRIFEEKRAAKATIYQNELSQAIYQKSQNMVSSLALQRYGEKYLKEIAEYIDNLPTREGLQIANRYNEALMRGDIQGALQILEEVRVRMINERKRQVQPKATPSVPHSEPPSPQPVIEERVSDQEEMDAFFEIT